MNRPKVGVALGSGGARGFAHIGVLKVLKQLGVPIDFLAGSSMGALVGSLYALHQDIDMMEKLAIHLKRRYWLDFSVNKLGLIGGEKVKELVNLLSHGKSLEELKLPMAVVATDLQNGERVVFREGPIDLAVRASISIPGIFTPVFWEDRILVDGGVVERVPISPLKEMGADVILAVDVTSDMPRLKIESLFDVISQTLDVMEQELFRYRVMDADLLIRPRVGHIPSTDFNQAEACIQAGEAAAWELAEALQTMMERWQQPGDTTP